MEPIYSDFVTKLEQLYGHFDSEGKKFLKAPNSEIARNLGYSDAQFSRLINEHATEGEYQRANQNADRILELINLENELKIYKQKSPKISWQLVAVLVIVGVIMGILLTYFMGMPNKLLKEENEKDISKYDMLRWSFETPFINPYTKLRELPPDCDFACYKYQGKWELKEGYKLPFLKERSGFHYSAVSAIMYARCNDDENPKGKNLEGFEYQLHEIWYDKRELPIDSFTTVNGKAREFYKKLDFNKDDNFVKIATIHTFYKDQFYLDTNQILRSGKDIARDVVFVPTHELAEIVKDKKLMDDLSKEITHITNNPLLEFSQPSECKTALLPNNDFNLIKEGDEMSFDCQMTTSRAVINYTKSFVLVDQYINEVCRPTPEGQL